MSEGNHTPGPWDAVHTSVESGRGKIADCFYEGFEGCWRSDEQMRANARLIAAAPDLLAACEAYIAVEHLKDPGAYLRGLDALVEQMRAAVAKARGTEA